MAPSSSQLSGLASRRPKRGRSHEPPPALPQVTLCAENAREAFENVEILKLRRAPYYTEEMAMQAEDVIEKLKAAKRAPRSRSQRNVSKESLDNASEREHAHPAKVVLRNLGMRLRLLSYFQPSVEEKNVASVQLIMARRELHRQPTSGSLARERQAPLLP